MSSKIPLHQLARVVADLGLAQGSQQTQKLSTGVAAYLLEEHRVSELGSLMRDVQKFWAQSGYIDILARVARPLPEKIYQELAKPFAAYYPQAKQVKVTSLIDAKVIGGAKMELAEQRLDISIARRLNRFKKAINVKGN
jgi:F0F1-type ATP synthase delta subunit